jgi:hypothetical protein
MDLTSDSVAIIDVDKNVPVHEPQLPEHLIIDVPVSKQPDVVIECVADTKQPPDTKHPQAQAQLTNECVQDTKQPQERKEPTDKPFEYDEKDPSCAVLIIKRDDALIFGIGHHLIRLRRAPFQTAIDQKNDTMCINMALARNVLLMCIPLNLFTKQFPSCTEPNYRVTHNYKQYLLPPHILKRIWRLHSTLSGSGFALANTETVYTQHEDMWFGFTGSRWIRILHGLCLILLAAFLTFVFTR